MKRRDFIAKAGIAAIGIQTMVLSSTQAAALGIYDQSTRHLSGMANVSADLEEQFTDLIGWMREHGWEELVTRISGLQLNISGTGDPNLIRRFQPRLNTVTGCDDFIGSQLVSPGRPHESLLYHLLASPRVRLDHDVIPDHYPSLQQLDILENVIYGMVAVTAASLARPGTVLAVFAYEYRPSSKTPHGCHADLVFSRSGFSRVGSQPIAPYDPINRCFSNKPADPAAEKEIAVTPARYGLFLATLVNSQQIENNDAQTEDNTTKFLLPYRKIYQGDPLLQGYELQFSESHVSERLKRLFEKTDIVSRPQGIAFRLNEAPFIRRSSSRIPGQVATAGWDNSLVDLWPTGSSVLLCSHPRPLVWPSTQRVGGKDERLRVKIPSVKHALLDSYYSNRRYTSLKTLDKDAQHGDALDVISDSLKNHSGRPVTHYKAPRNAPMFINIRDEVKEDSGETIQQIGTDYPELLAKTNSSYWVGLFEDNICHGCIQAGFSGSNPTGHLPQILAMQVLPAFSIVTAPDFFPMVESYDMRPYKDLFLSGGVQDISGARLKADPNVYLPGTTLTAFPNVSNNETEANAENSILAIVTGKHNPNGHWQNDAHDIAQARTQTRSNFLPDSATLIFFPGWDVTYSNNLDGAGELAKKFYSTMGLGLPFMEDSKLCAAANGMWAAASPDASRTFRGTLSVIPTKGLAPTAVPLLDTELGLHPSSPAVIAFNQSPSTGWDGEQGPFLFQDGNRFSVNFTDINRSDYVQNALHGMFDMSLMRQITIAEITDRMAGLKHCYDQLSPKKIWLVSAEKVTNWDNGSRALGIPPGLLRASRPFRMPGQGSGYLYIFAETSGDVVKTGTKRVLQNCDILHICLISNHQTKIGTLRSSTNWNASWTLFS